MLLFVLFCIGAVIAFTSIKKVYSVEEGFGVRCGVVLGMGLLMHVVTQLMWSTLAN